MQVSGVTKEDGLACAQLMQFLVRIQGLSGAEVESFVRSKQWIHALALQMAEQLRGPTPPPAAPVPSAPAADSGFRVRAMGPIGSAPSKKSRSSKKK